MDPVVDLVLGQLCHFQTERDIVKHIQMGEQSVALKHRIDLPLIGRHIVDAFTVKGHRAGSGRQKAADDPQSGSLAAAGGAQQGEEFMVINIQVDTVKYPLSVELHGKIPEPDQFFGHYPPPFLSYFFVGNDNYTYIPKIALCQRIIPENYIYFSAGPGKIPLYF